MIQITNKRKYFYLFSGTLLILSFAAIFSWGLKLGIDFKGGTLMQVRFESEVPSNEQLEEKFRELELESLSIQRAENNSVILRYADSDDDLNEAVFQKTKEFDSGAKQMKVNFIGASVSDQIKKNSLISVILGVFAIMAYIAWAFRKVSRPIPSWQYGLWAIAALFHDILVTIGVFSVLGKFWNVEVGVPFIAALLTILGYSINDTIVVYDRTRENLMRLGNKKEDFESVVNRSLNETMRRSLNTGITVIAVLVIIFFWGGESVKFFSLALLIGIAFGTYSSIFVASSLLVTSYRFKVEKQ